MSIQASVIVPTYKRPQLLLNCLRALVKQNFRPECYEVIVVDDEASEETMLLVEQFARSARQMEAALGPGMEAHRAPSIKYIAAVHSQGPAAARNTGWRAARGEFIAFTDDDCIPEPDWLKEGIVAFSNDLDAVSGQVIVPVTGEPTDYEKNVSRLSESEFVTANCFYRRDKLEECGGFDERFTSAWREDSDLQFKMMKLSFKLGHANSAKVVHPVRPAPWGVSIKEERKNMFNALLYKKYPALYKDRIQPLPPIRYYAIVLSTLVFFWALLSGRAAIAVSLALFWLALVLDFTLLRLENTKRSPAHVLEMLVTSIVIPYLSIFWRLYGAVYFRVFFL